MSYVNLSIGGLNGDLENMDSAYTRMNNALTDLNDLLNNDLGYLNGLTSGELTQLKTQLVQDIGTLQSDYQQARIALEEIAQHHINGDKQGAQAIAG